VGTYAVISLMVYSTIQRLELEYVESDAYSQFKHLNQTLNNGSVSDHIIDDHLMEFKIKVSTSLAFWCGIVQVKTLFKHLAADLAYFKNKINYPTTDNFSNI